MKFISFIRKHERLKSIFNQDEIKDGKKKGKAWNKVQPGYTSSQPFFGDRLVSTIAVIRAEVFGSLGGKASQGSWYDAVSQSTLAFFLAGSE